MPKTVDGVKTNYYMRDDKIVAQKGAKDLVFHYDENNELVSFNDLSTNKEYLYMRNIQGDVLAIVDSTWQVVVEYTYDAWGKLTSTTGSMASTLGVQNPFRYRGYFYDTETGLYYLQSRYYNPEWCRFINADEPEILGMTQGNILGANLFAYANNNPVMNVDPSGYASGGVNKVKFNWWGFDLYLSNGARIALGGGIAIFVKIIEKLIVTKAWVKIVGVLAIASQTYIAWVGRKGNGVILRYLYAPFCQLYWVKSQ